MTRGSLSPTDGRTLALGIVVVVVVLLVGKGGPALRARTKERELRAADAVARATRAEWARAHASELRRTLASARNRLAIYDSALVDGATPSAASARLAELVTDAAEGTEARIGSITLSADSASTSTGLAHVSARASVSGDLNAVGLLLQSLDEGPQLLAVRELIITQTQPALPHTQAEVLQAELVIEGLFRGDSHSAQRTR